MEFNQRTRPFRRIYKKPPFSKRQMDFGGCALTKKKEKHQGEKEGQNRKTIKFQKTT